MGLISKRWWPDFFILLPRSEIHYCFVCLEVIDSGGRNFERRILHNCILNPLNLTRCKPESWVVSFRNIKVDAVLLSRPVWGYTTDNGVLFTRSLSNTLTEIFCEWQHRALIKLVRLFLRVERHVLDEEAHAHSVVLWHFFSPSYLKEQKSVTV